MTSPAGSITLRICGILCAAALILVASPARADELPPDIQFASCSLASCEGDVANGVSLAACCPAEPVADASVDYCPCQGSCQCGSLSDELSQRMAAMAKRMQAQGITYAPGVTQF